MVCPAAFVSSLRGGFSKRRFGTICGHEIREDVVDVVAGGAGPLDTRRIGVQPHDNGHSSAKASSGPGLTAADVQIPLRAIGNGTQKNLERVKIRVPSLRPHPDELFTNTSTD